MAKLLAVHPVLASRDVERSIRFYAALGFVETFRDAANGPRYAAVVRDGVELHLQWHDPAGWLAPGDRPVLRLLVDDPDALHAEFREMDEVTDLKPVFDSAWGTREFHGRDPDGNGLQFYRPA